MGEPESGSKTTSYAAVVRLPTIRSLERDQTNLRDDEYGGDIGRRTRFAAEVIEPTFSI